MSKVAEIGRKVDVSGDEQQGRGSLDGARRWRHAGMQLGVAAHALAQLVVRSILLRAANVQQVHLRNGNSKLI